MSTKDPVKRRKLAKAWRDANPAKIKAYRRDYRLKYPRKVRDRGYRDNYGIGLEDVEAMFRSQEGFCACCDDPIKLPSRRTHVDHCHSTGKVRGVICGKCNALLGYANDSTDTLRRAIAYLNHFRRKT